MPSCLLQSKLSLRGLPGFLLCRKSSSHGCKFGLDLDPHHVLILEILLHDGLRPHGFDQVLLNGRLGNSEPLSLSRGPLRLLLRHHPRLLLSLCPRRGSVPGLHEGDSGGLGLLRLSLSLLPQQLLFFRDLNRRLLLELRLVLVRDGGVEFVLKRVLLRYQVLHLLLVLQLLSLGILVSLRQEQLESGDLLRVRLLHCVHVGLELRTDHLIDSLVLLRLLFDAGLLLGGGFGEGLFDGGREGLLNGGLNGGLHLRLGHRGHRRFHLYLIIVTYNRFNSCPIRLLCTSIPEQIRIRVALSCGRLLGRKGVLSGRCSLLGRERIIICRSLLC